MKNAKLWKMILNNGAQADIGYEEKFKTVIKGIITSRIIYDSRPCDEVKRSGDVAFKRFLNLCIPFDNTWVETSTSYGELTGCYFHKRIDSNVYDVICIGKPENIPFPIYIGNTCVDFGNINYFCKDIKVYIADIVQRCTKDSIGVFYRGLYTACDTLYTLSCKNISLKPNPIEPHQAKRAAKRHGGNPDDYRYHTLVVHPPGANKSTSVGQDIGIMPRHICRGHFSEYGPDFGKGLLFGKYSGRFFIPPHMKGKKENGIVEKDYEIRTQS